MAKAAQRITVILFCVFLAGFGCLHLDGAENPV